MQRTFSPIAKPSRRSVLSLGGGALTALLLTACGKKQPRGRPVAKGATVLALGDSITAGVGATPETAYPAVLARLSGWNVVNGGVSGDTSAQALERLGALLQEHSPALVIVSIGGNDFLRRQSQGETRATIQRICQQAAASGAQVVLVAVPQPSLSAVVARSLSDHPMYAELAGEMKLPLHANGWSDVLAKPELRSDAIHANAQGYELFARGLADTLKAAGILV